MNTLIPKAILYLSAYSKYQLSWSYEMWSISIPMVISNLKKYSKEYQKVKEKPINERR